MVTVSGWLGSRTVDRDLPPNMCEIGDSFELAYMYANNVKFSAERETIIGALCRLGFPPLSDPRQIWPLPPLPRILLHSEQRPARAF